MANLDDLGYVSISDMSTDESIELLRQIRLSRRIPTKATKTSTKKKEVKSSSISAEQAAEILKILGGSE